MSFSAAPLPFAHAERPLRVGLLGAGTVGAALIRLVAAHPHLEVRRALVRDLGRPREIPHPERLLTTDPDEALDGVDVVVELLGGLEPATSLVLRALAAGKPVVTANKALLAERWSDLLPYLRAGRLRFEASVMAGTPVIGPLTGALRGSSPRELHAILNGTCNYVLGRLEQGDAYEDAVAEAQRLGYAEADPTLDVEGFDAAHKLTVLARLAFDPELAWEELRASTNGISHLTPAIVREAMEDGGRVRLLGSIVPRDGRWEARVRPVYLPADHPLAGAATERNGLLFVGDAVGEVLLAGAGAGAMPTASAVLADLLAFAEGRPGPVPPRRAARVPDDWKPRELGELLREQ